MDDSDESMCTDVYRAMRLIRYPFTCNSANRISAWKATSEGICHDEEMMTATLFFVPSHDWYTADKQRFHFLFLADESRNILQTEV